MKNQVNKKVSKLLISLLALVVMCVSGFVLVACNEECSHSNMTASNDTATCVAGGVITHTCADCGYSYNETTEAKGHNFDEGYVVAPTCTNGGYTVITCKDCDESSEKDFTEATGHKYGTPVVVESTCHTPGSETVECEDCGHTVSTPLALKDHKYTNPVETAPTCTEDGYVTSTCECGATKVEASDKKATGHSFTNNVEFEQEANCSTDGYKIIRCDGCDVTKQVKTENATGHSFTVVKEVAATCTNGGYTIEECAACDAQKITETPAIGHDFENGASTVISEATCTTAGVELKTCANCAETAYVPTAALGHSYGATVTVNATCENAGYEYSVCSECGYEHKVETAPALGGKCEWVATKVEIASTCREKGYGTLTCTVCGGEKNGELELAPHTYTVVNVTEATCTAPGTITKSCEYCNDTYQDSETIALGHNWTVTVSVNATCTTNGYTAIACERCHAEKKGSRVDTTTALGYHTMIIGDTLAPQLTVYSDGETMWVEESGVNVELALCNYFGKYDEGEYAFYCTLCNADEMATVTVLDPTSITVDEHFIPVSAGLTHCIIDREAHTFETPDAALSIAALCETTGTSVKVCTVCAADDAYRTFTADKLAYASLVAADLQSGAQAVSYAEVTETGATGHVIPGECTVAVDPADPNNFNWTTAGACTTTAIHHYGCIQCNIAIEDLVADATPIATVRVDAWMKAVDAEGNKTVIATAYAALNDGAELPEVGSYIDIDAAMVAKFQTEALGHNHTDWVIATAIDNDGYATVYDLTANTLCDAGAKFFVAQKCVRCNHVAEGYTEVANHAHANYTFDATTGAFAWSNVKYYTYYTENVEANGVTNYKGTAYEITADEVQDGWVEGVDYIVVYDYANKNDEDICVDSFECELCGKTDAPAIGHVADCLDSAIGCYVSQSCLVCNDLLVAASHIVPDNTCVSLYDDEYYYCDNCKSFPLGLLTAHSNITATASAEANCVQAEYYTLSCGCGETLEAGDKFILDTELKNKIGKFTEAVGAEITLAVNDTRLVIDQLNHTVTTEVTDVTKTCIVDGKYSYDCSVCNKALVAGDKVTVTDTNKDFVAFKGATVGDTLTLTEATYTVIATGHVVAETADVTDSTAVGYNVALEPTCTTDGYFAYTCKTCNATIGYDEKVDVTGCATTLACYTNGTFAADGLSFTFDQDDVKINKLGHDITVDLSDSYNCVLGKVVKTAKCENGCGIDAYAGAEFVNGILYATKAYDYLISNDVDDYVTGGAEALAQAMFGTDYVADGAGFKYAAKNHNYTTFDTKGGESTDGGITGTFKAPTTTEDGDAYWTCDDCGARNFIKGSVTWAQYNDYNVNADLVLVAKVNDQVVFEIKASEVATSTLISASLVDGVYVYTLTADGQTAVYNAATAAGATVKFGETAITAATELTGSFTNFEFVVTAA